MRSRRPIGVHGAWLPLMQRPGVHGVHGGVKTPPIALRPVLDREGEIVGWQCRTDMPWSGDAAMVSTHGAQRSSSAVIGSLLGARDLAVCCGYGEPDELKRLSAIAEACEGAPWEDLAATYGAEHANAASSIVGSFFGKALRKIGKVAKGAVKLASPALSLVPGGSLATAAFNAASPTLKRAVMKQGHVPPKQRQPVRVSPLRDVPRANATPLQNRAHPGGGGPQWLPYPYPLPYPVPGWSQPSAGAEQPGLAWPRMT
jgi:hypothetical protein